MKSIKDIELNGKTVLLRADVNVPFAKDGSIDDDFRVRESIPTIKYIGDQGGTCVIIGHLGRPEEGSKELSLKPVAERLEVLLDKKVLFVENLLVPEMQSGEIALLENIRFYKGEEENDPAFARQLADLGDVYINDAFAVDHRAHASLVGIPKYLPSAMGLLLEKEIHALEKVSKNPEKPLVVVIGGAKVETKAGFLQAISEKADAILLGNLISKQVQDKKLDVFQDTELVYATDGVDGDFDLGGETTKAFEEKIKEAKTIFWAGPLGMIEEEKYEKGSIAIAEAMISSGAFTVAGGGDLVAFLNKHNYTEKFNHVSTGGGAMLAFLAGEELPGLMALEK